MGTTAHDAQIGISDLPVGLGRTRLGTDQLGMATYCAGLTDFILRCPTPMTVAVQGDWGTGKTSTMWLVAEQLKERSKATVVTFNTWQYSQFDLGEDLAFHLLQTILEGLKGDEIDKKAYLQKAWLATTKAGRAAVATLSHVVAEKVGGSVGGVTMDAFVDELLRTGTQRSPAGLLEELRDSFAGLVRRNNERTGGRTVIFIDDLDRIRPARAVEIMEVLKSVMDVDGCVYVLAIDFTVVLQGVREKYGEDFDARKAAAFFDKIIQIPFHMPVTSYDIEPLLRMHGRDFGGDTAAAVQLLRTSVGRNPRSVKRILNAIALNECIQDQVARHDAAGGLRPLELLASAALQAAYPDFYEQLDRADTEGKAALLHGVLHGDEGASVPYRVAEDDLPAFREFIEGYVAALQLRRGSRSGEVDGERVEQLMRITSVTTGHRASTRETQVARVLDLESRVANQEDRGLDGALLDRLRTLEQTVREQVGGLVVMEAKGGSVWRWYAQGEQDGMRASGGHFCEILLPLTGRPTFYVGRRTWEDTEELRRSAEELLNEGWTLVVSETSNALVHVKSVPPEADLQRLVPLLVASHRAAL